MLTPQQLLREINDGKFRPAYYFYGAEDYRIIEATKYLARQFLPDRQLTTNYRKLNGRKASAGDVIAELSNLPMLGERQVFSISDFQSFQPGQVEAILKLLTPPDPNRVVIFSSPSARTPKKKSKFFNTVSATVEAVEFAKLSGREVQNQIQTRIKKAGLQIEPEALRLLAELVGGNLGAVVGEIDKLINFKSAGEMVTPDDVTSVVAGYEVINIFQLADEVVTGSPGRVLKMLEQLIAEGSSPVTICTLLTNHFLRLYLVRNDKPLPRNFAWLASRLRPQANRYENTRLEQILRELARTEADLRGGNIPPRIELEMLVMSLVSDQKIRHG